MKYSIELVDGVWILSRDGEQVDTFDTYENAVIHLAGIGTSTLPGGTDNSDDGLLPETWTSPDGICFAIDTPYRDFTSVAWSWRDPAASLLPVMLQTKNLPAHMEAELAGFITEVSMPNAGTPQASGRFYDNEAGRAARDLLLGGRRFGVSVDPSEKVDAEFVCTETDEDGWCIDGKTVFSAYEIAGLTMEPHPCFEMASIVLGSADATQVITAARTEERGSLAPIVPPRAWFEMEEPGDDSELVVVQPDGGLAVPFTILDSGHVYGNLARWGQCHIGSPWGPGVCVEPPLSSLGYSAFHTGAVVTDDGTQFATGVMCVGADHAPEDVTLFDAQSYYAHSAMGWADVHVTNGVYGPWACGALRPGVDAEDVRVLRALAPSGDWRELNDDLELIGVLAVNGPGFPIARQLVRASRKMAGTPDAKLRVKIRGGKAVVLQSAGMVMRCRDCAERAAAEAAGGSTDTSKGLMPRLERLERTLGLVERRTRHLAKAEAETIRASL